MFFAPHLAREAEEDAEAEEDEQLVPDATAAGAPPGDAKKPTDVAPPLKTATDDGVSRVVGSIERIQVELHGALDPGAKEKVTLPDGRVVESHTRQCRTR